MKEGLGKPRLVETEIKKHGRAGLLQCSIDEKYVKEERKEKKFLAHAAAND